MIRRASRLSIPGNPVNSSSLAEFKSNVLSLPFCQPSFMPSTAAFTSRPASSIFGFASAAAFAACSRMSLSRSAESPEQPAASRQPPTASAVTAIHPCILIACLLIPLILYSLPPPVYPQFPLLASSSLSLLLHSFFSSLLLTFQKRSRFKYPEPRRAPPAFRNLTFRPTQLSPYASTLAP